MHNRREFLRAAALGTTAAMLPLLLRGATPPAAAPSAAAASGTDSLDDLLSRLKTAEQLGVAYVRDSLDLHALHPSKLLVRTHLADPGKCGRRSRGWAVSGGVPESDTTVTLRGAPILGNRSQYARFSFCSTQRGLPRGEYGLVEMRLCRGTTSDDVPLRIRLENGCFYILGLNQDTVLAGDATTRRFTLTPDTVYSLSVLLFQKAVYARLSGSDVPGGMLELVIPDRRRFIPGRPGFGLRAHEQATSGELAIFDWLVTPVGPAENCQLGVMGDSITAGNDGEPEAESYVHLATRGLGQALVLNTGSGGSTTTLDAARFPFEIAPFRPRITWIEGGTNDIGAGLSAASAFENILLQAALVTWGGQVVLSTVPPRPLANDAQYGQLTELNRLIRESGHPFVDRHAVVCDPADNRLLLAEFAQPDHIHITRAGHVLIADEALSVFKKF
jgi:lysophospholipase L1-like esterase